MGNNRQAGFLIAKIHYLSSRILSQKLKENGLNEINPGQGRILFALWQGDGITIQELSKRTSLGKSTLTSMLDRLEETGYLSRVPSEKDRRKTLVKLSDKDKSLRDAYAKVSEEITILFYDGFSNEEIDMLETFLERIYDNVSKCSSNRVI